MRNLRKLPNFCLSRKFCYFTVLVGVFIFAVTFLPNFKLLNSKLIVHAQNLNISADASKAFEDIVNNSQKKNQDNKAQNNKKLQQSTGQQLTSQQQADPIEAYLSKAFCSDKAGTTEFPYKALILVDLNKFYADLQAGNVDNEQAITEFLYEFLYINQYKLWPFNAIVVNGKIYRSSCDKWDFTLNPYVNTLKNYGVYVVGFLGSMPNNLSSIKHIVNKYKFDSVYTAQLVQEILDNKQVLLARNISKCKSTCYGVSTKLFGLSKNAIYARPVNLTVTKVEYKKTLKSLDKTEVAITVKNNSNVTLLSSKYYSVYVKELSSKNIPDLYVKSWDSLHIPVHVNNEPILPYATKTIKFEIGPYVYPKIYSGKFALYLDNKRLPNTNFDINVKVSKGNLKLGYIKGRDLDYVNVHSRPGLREPVTFKLDVGEYVIVNKVDGAWVNITAQYGDTGWVYRPMIRIED